MSSLQLVSVAPIDMLSFPPETRTAVLTLRNTYTTTVNYQVKTNCPDNYSVSPSRGSLEVGSNTQISILLKDVVKDTEQKHRFQIVASTADGLSSTINLKVKPEKEELAAQFVTSVLGEEPAEDVEKTKASMQDLQAQSLRTTKELDHMRLEIQKLEHQLRFRGESKLQALESSGYSMMHLLLGFVVGLLLAAITR